MKNSDSTDEKILNQIYWIRNQKVMIDADLASLYQVETRRLKEAVRRNLNRFPADFMFEMNQTEMELWLLQSDNSTATRQRPFCFTEQGVTMLACVLNSDVAIEMNIRIIRLFTRMRDALANHKEILARLDSIEGRIGIHDDKLIELFNALRLLLTREPIRVKTKSIGFNKERE